jgi:hypothetical protein
MVIKNRLNGARFLIVVCSVFIVSLQGAQQNTDSSKEKKELSAMPLKPIPKRDIRFIIATIRFVVEHYKYSFARFSGEHPPKSETYCLGFPYGEERAYRYNTCCKGSRLCAIPGALPSYVFAMRMNKYVQEGDQIKSNSGGVHSHENFEMVVDAFGKVSLFLSNPLEKDDDYIIKKSNYRNVIAHLKETSLEGNPQDFNQRRQDQLRKLSDFSKSYEGMSVEVCSAAHIALLRAKGQNEVNCRVALCPSCQGYLTYDTGGGKLPSAFAKFARAFERAQHKVSV